MVPLFKTIGNEDRLNEIKYVQIFKEIQLTKGFYFSYTYDLTHTLQDNIIHQIHLQKLKEDNETESNKSVFDCDSYNTYEKIKANHLNFEDNYKWDEKYIWNHFLIYEFQQIVDKKWVLPITHGQITMLSTNNLFNTFRFGVRLQVVQIHFNCQKIKTLRRPKVFKKRM